MCKRYTYVHIHTHKHTHTHTHTHTYTHTYVCMYIYIYIYIYTYRYIYTHTYTYLCIRIYIHTYIHIHIYIQTPAGVSFQYRSEETLPVATSCITSSGSEAPFCWDKVNIYECIAKSLVLVTIWVLGLSSLFGFYFRGVNFQFDMNVSTRNSRLESSTHACQKKSNLQISNLTLCWHNFVRLRPFMFLYQPDVCVYKHFKSIIVLPMIFCWYIVDPSLVHCWSIGHSSLIHRWYFVHSTSAESELFCIISTFYVWCCFYYFVWNSLVALLEALCARLSSRAASRFNDLLLAPHCMLKIKKDSLKDKQTKTDTKRYKKLRKRQRERQWNVMI